jgi:hypothetical protein
MLTSLASILLKVYLHQLTDLCGVDYLAGDPAQVHSHDAAD